MIATFILSPLLIWLEYHIYFKTFHMGGLLIVCDFPVDEFASPGMNVIEYPRGFEITCGRSEFTKSRSATA